MSIPLARPARSEEVDAYEEMLGTPQAGQAPGEPEANMWQQFDPVNRVTGLMFRSESSAWQGVRGL